MTALLELCPEIHCIARLKALLDVRLGVIGTALRLAHESFHSARRCSRELKMPMSSGRVVLTGAGAERKIPHMDFTVPDRGPAGSRYVVPS